MSTKPLPQHIGRYEILGELGKGAMGVVYKAQDPTIGRLVALKTMRLDAHGMESGEMLARFKNEARAAGILNHSNIVTIYDAGEFDGMFYIAMEYIEGTTLQKTLNEEGSVPIEQVIEFARQICSGLDYAHSHKIIHRDVKPANIMIESEGRLKIMDFGIAKGEGAGLTSAGQVLGTPNYMSPEQVKGRPLDGRSDLWSFGVILYEMVTGEKPFSGQNVTTIIYKIVNEEPIPPKELDSSIHPGLSAVIQRALAKNPDKRYQKGADLVHHLVNHRAIGMDTDALAAQSSGSHAVTVEPAAPPAPAAAPSELAAPPSPPAKPAPEAQPAASKPAAAPAAPARPAKARPEPNETLVSGFHTYHPPETGKKSPVVAAQNVASKLTPNQWLMVAAAVLAVVIVGFALGIRHQTQPPAAAPAPTEAAASPTSAPEQSSAPAATATPPAQTAEAAPEPAAGAPQAAPKVRTKVPKEAPLAAAPAAGAAAAGPVNGTLHLATTPPGAKVEIDGWSDPNWITPFDSPNLSGGKHKIAFSKPGFASQTQIVDVFPGKQAVVSASLNAVAAPARLEIVSDPAGALIMMDAKETGKQTPASLEVAAGDHKITLHKLGYKDVSLAASVKAGETGHVSQSLKAGSGSTANPLGKIFGGGAPEGMGNLQVKTKPKGATVKVNGEEAPKTTPFKLPLDPGTYNVAISLAGYKAQTQAVTIEKGKTANVEIELQK